MNKLTREFCQFKENSHECGLTYFEYQDTTAGFSHGPQRCLTHGWPSSTALGILLLGHLHQLPLQHCHLHPQTQHPSLLQGWSAYVWMLASYTGQHYSCIHLFGCLLDRSFHQLCCLVSSVWSVDQSCNQASLCFIHVKCSIFHNNFNHLIKSNRIWESHWLCILSLR